MKDGGTIVNMSEFTTTAYSGIKVEPEPKTAWVWYVFGKGPGSYHLMVVSIPAGLHLPLWRRIVCRIFMGSRFERAKS